jgi:hypothetical protein
VHTTRLPATQTGPVTAVKEQRVLTEQRATHLLVTAAMASLAAPVRRDAADDVQPPCCLVAHDGTHNVLGAELLQPIGGMSAGLPAGPSLDRAAACSGSTWGQRM